MISPAYDLGGWRKRIPLLATHIPMNNCSHAPQMDCTRAAAERYLDSWNTRGMDWDAWMEEVGRAKESFARLIHASAADIAVFSSVSEATSAVASAFDFGGARGTVVASEAEFPGVGQVWSAQAVRGARVRWVPVVDGAIDITAYDAAIDDRTAVVSACHAYYLNGFTQDVAQIARRAHARGALLYVDAYQSAGAVPIDVQALDVDFLVAGTLKFLMGVPGIAFLYVRPEVAASLQPTVTGWFGRREPYAFDVKARDSGAGAARFDTGTPPIVNAYVARAGIDAILEIGVDRIHAWHEVLAYRLLDGARARGFRVANSPDHPEKTVTTACVVENAHAVETAMLERGVIASARGPVIRLAPHFYSSIDDVDRALDVLAEVAPR